MTENSGRAHRLSGVWRHRARRHTGKVSSQGELMQRAERPHLCCTPLETRDPGGQAGRVWGDFLAGGEEYER